MTPAAFSKLLRYSDGRGALQFINISWVLTSSDTTFTWICQHTIVHNNFLIWQFIEVVYISIILTSTFNLFASRYSPSTLLFQTPYFFLLPTLKFKKVYTTEDTPQKNIHECKCSSN